MKNKKRPFVSLCTGMSFDGKLSNKDKQLSPISSDDDREMLFDARVRADAVVVGGNTLVLDEPSLTVKSKSRQVKRLKVGKSKEPIKVAIVSNVDKVKLKSDFFDKGWGEKIIFTTQKSSKQKIEKIKSKAQIFVMGKDKVNLTKAMEKLYDLGIRKVVVEGGGTLIFSLLKEKLIDEINLKIGDLIIGGKDSVTFCDGIGFKIKKYPRVKIIKCERYKNSYIFKAKVIY